MYIRFKHGYRHRKGDEKWVRISRAMWLDKDASIRHFYEVKPALSATPKQREALTRGQILRYLMAAEAQLALARRAMDSLKDPHCADTHILFTDEDIDACYQLAQLGRNKVNEALNKMRMSGVNRYRKPKGD